MAQKEVKNSTRKNDFYIKVLSKIKITTNLTTISKDLGIKKQNLNYYLRGLKNSGLIINKSNGEYELTEKGKNPTKYDNFLPKDFIRGHAYIFEIKLPKEIKGWDKRIEILDKKNIHYILVGAKLNTPRIKVLGRKVWLCKNHIRIYDKKDESYYTECSVESRKQAFWTLYKIAGIIENKLNVTLKPFEFEFKREHYALIKNDLAIEHNQKGEILRISDESGEWLLIDDSLEKGGELETIGKKSLIVNRELQNWWNNQKETNFKVTPDFVLKVMNGIQENQLSLTKNMDYYGKNLVSHIEAIQTLSKEVKRLSRVFKQTIKENKKYKLGTQSLLSDY